MLEAGVQSWALRPEDRAVDEVCVKRLSYFLTCVIVQYSLIMKDK